MKLILQFLLLFLSVAAAENTVLDTDGESLRAGVEYYILPVFRGRGGGLGLAGRNDTCPLFVAQENQELDLGLPVTFSPANTSDETIQLSTDLNVQFSTLTICVQSNVWKISDVDDATGRIYVAGNGVKGNPGKDTVSNWFKIEQYGSDYVLEFCPSICEICRVLCGYLGVFVEEDKRWLGLFGDTFPVMFKKSSPDMVV